MMKTAISGQYLLWVSRSSIWPSATSWLATMARGLNDFGSVPWVWFSCMDMTT